MVEQRLTEREKARFWLIARRGLYYVDPSPPVTKGSVEQLLAVLPEWLPDESIGSWLKRANNPPTQVISFPKRVRRFQTVTEFFRMAADSGSERYPLPEKTLESADGRFWLTIWKVGDDLELTLQALGMAIDEFARSTLVLAASADADALLAVIQLDERGEGHGVVADTLATRKALLHPILGLLESGEA